MCASESRGVRGTISLGLGFELKIIINFLYVWGDIMENNIVKEIVKLVSDIYNLNFDISNFKKYDELRELTEEAWEEHHNELLFQLGSLEPEWNIDFQLFWYDCLGYPQQTPKTFFKNGKPSYVFYGWIPSKIDESVKDFGFHDQIIKNVIYEDNTITLILDGQGWVADDYQVKLKFKGVESILSKVTFEKNDDYFILSLNLKDIIHKMILSARELPMINYIFENIRIDKSYLNTQKRLFWIEISGNEYIIIFDTWEYEKK